MTGSEIREFRRNKNWNIDHLAKLLGISVWKLQTVERSAESVPTQIEKSFETLVRASDAGAISSDANKPRHRFRDFRRSTSFSQRPPFTTVPHCPCGNALCVLAPTGDGDWDGKHLWKFVGRVCHKTHHVDSDAVVVPRPLRHPPRDLPLDDFRNWPNFSEAPPFSEVPNCPCGKARCRLRPKKDFDRDGRHLWKFKGWKCQRISYLDSNGALVPPPAGLTRDPQLRDPVLLKRCSKCGRIRFLNRQFRIRLGCRVAILSCLRKPGDSPNQEHDPPEYFRENEGKMSPLAAEDHDIMRGRSKQKFPVPLCESDGCSRRGKRMERSSESLHKDANGNSFRLARYCCRPAKPTSRHYAFRVLPHGEAAKRIGEGRYCWLDALTGLRIETVHKRRAIREDRVMPVANCPKHSCALEQDRGPWKIRGQRQWRATCPVGLERYKVRNDGSIHPGGSRWMKNKGGRPTGMSEQRKTEGAKLLRTMLDFSQKQGKVRGALRVAARLVYKSQDPVSAYDTANKTAKEYVETFPDDPLVIEWKQVKKS